MTKSGLKYAIYTRKSQENRDRQALSIDSQISELQEFARKEGLNVVKVLKESQTAFKPGRPVFAELMEYAEEGIVEAVLAWKPDRIARNALDGGRFIQAIDDGYIAELRTPYERFRKEDNRMMLYIHFGMSNDYSRQISANVKRGNREKYRRGEYVGKAPLGYLNEKVGNSRNITPDPDKAPVIKQLFQDYSTGNYSVMDMVRKADSLGLSSVYGRKIAKSGMYTLLQRSAYYGVYEHAGEAHEGSYEPLISKSLFDKVQDVLANKGKPRKRDWSNHAYKGGLIKCAECGCSITATTKVKFYKKTGNTGVYSYYHCSKRRGKCGQKPVKDDELELMLKGYISKVEIDKEVWELGIELLKAKHANEMQQIESARVRKQMEYNKVEKDLERLLEMRMSEEITPEEYIKAKGQLLDQRVALKEQLEDKEHSSDNWLELAENFFETAFRARSIMDGDDTEAKRALVHAVGSNLLLRDGELEFSFKKPFDVLLKPSVRSDVQGRRESNPQ